MNRNSLGNGFFLLIFFNSICLTLFAQSRPEYLQRLALLRQAIEKQFRDPATGNYLEKNVRAANDNKYAYLWPLCGLVQAANEWEQTTGHTGMLDSVLSAIDLYYDDSPPAPGFASYIVKEKREDRFYDDNQWIGIACMDAFERTAKTHYLNRAQVIYRFMMTGFDTTTGGGLYWKEHDKSTKNTCSNGPGIILALQLYKATQQKKYLDTAVLLYKWTKLHLLAPEGVYYDNIKIPSGNIDRHFYTYNTGTMLQSSVMLYRITKDSSYLQNAQGFAAASLRKFFERDRFPSHYWFNAVLLRGYIDLAKMDHRKEYVDAMRTYGEKVWEQDRSIPPMVGKKAAKELIDQAAMLEIYSRLARE